MCVCAHAIFSFGELCFLMLFDCDSLVTVPHNLGIAGVVTARVAPPSTASQEYRCTPSSSVSPAGCQGRAVITSNTVMPASANPAWWCWSLESQVLLHPTLPTRSGALQSWPVLLADATFSASVYAGMGAAALLDCTCSPQPVSVPSSLQENIP